MKTIRSLIFIAVCLWTAINFCHAQNQQKPFNIPDSTKPIQVVKTACGMCMFGMKSDDCSLAVEIDGKYYFVKGTGIDDHGNAHAKDGFCNAIRKAAVQGKIVDGFFVASYFKLKNGDSNPGKKSPV